MAHEHVYALCEDMCLEETMTKGQILNNGNMKELTYVGQEDKTSEQPTIQSNCSGRIDTSTTMGVQEISGIAYGNKDHEEIDFKMYTDADNVIDFNATQENLHVNLRPKAGGSYTNTIVGLNNALSVTSQSSSNYVGIYCYNNTLTFWWDLKKQRNITAKIYTANLYFELYGSNDNETWTYISNLGGGSDKSIPFVNQYRYVKAVTDATNGTLYYFYLAIDDKQYTIRNKFTVDVDFTLQNNVLVKAGNDFSRANVIQESVNGILCNMPILPNLLYTLIYDGTNIINSNLINSVSGSLSSRQVINFDVPIRFAILKDISGNILYGNSIITSPSTITNPSSSSAYYVVYY